MAEDDAVYRRSVRNTVIVITAMIVVIAAALIVPPLVSPAHEQFNSVTSVASPYGLSLSLRLNETQFAAGQGVAITAWINSTSSEVANISAASTWALGPRGFWTKVCTNGWPLGVGLMAGYFTTDNYSLGSLVPLPSSLVGCPISAGTPSYFLLQPRGSIAIVKLGGSLAQWNLTTVLQLSSNQLTSQRSVVFTAITVDEWGDLAITHLRLSQ